MDSERKPEMFAYRYWWAEDDLDTDHKTDWALAMIACHGMAKLMMIGYGDFRIVKTMVQRNSEWSPYALAWAAIETRIRDAY